jgi:hypothetical protein
MNELDSITNSVLLSLPHQYETYVENMGAVYVAIRQKEGIDGENDCVVLSKSQALLVADALRTFAESK